MEFDSEGRIILPGAVKEDLEKDAGSIIIDKKQINLKSPAIAQLKISIGSNLRKKLNEDVLIKEIYYFCKNFAERSWRFNEVESKTELVGATVIIEARSSLQMYGLLNTVTEEMHELYVRNKNIPVSIRGGFG